MNIVYVLPGEMRYWLSLHLQMQWAEGLQQLRLYWGDWRHPAIACGTYPAVVLSAAPDPASSTPTVCMIYKIYFKNTPWDVNLLIAIFQHQAWPFLRISITRLLKQDMVRLQGRTELKGMLRPLDRLSFKFYWSFYKITEETVRWCTCLAFDARWDCLIVYLPLLGWLQNLRFGSHLSKFKPRSRQIS